MKAALIVNQVGPDREENLRRILDMALEGVNQGAGLILLPEAALTGLINNDDPAHDLPLGETIPGPATDLIASFCRQHGVWFSIGLLEREGDSLYDTAVLFDLAGEIKLKYRRQSAGWHGRKADSGIYRAGSELTKVSTPFGSMAFLICGDLFDEELVRKVRDLKPDLLLFPFARCFGDGTADQGKWDREELPQYLDRIQTAGVPALMVNYLAERTLGDNSFGGAHFVLAEGKLISSLPLGRPGMLVMDMPSAG